MNIETTLILCKPDAVARGLVGEIVGRIERRGYIVTGEHKDKPFFADLVGFITSGPLVALAVEGTNAIDGCRQIVGATDPLAAAPGSIRGDLAQTIGRNLVHGSDSAESAKRELKIFFTESDFVSRRHDLDRWIKD